MSNKEYYNISGDFHLDMTIPVEDESVMPSMRQMTNELQELFATALDQYLHEKGLAYEEVHAITADPLSWELA